jgi:hypothetical protein
VDRRDHLTVAPALLAEPVSDVESCVGGVLVVDVPGGFELEGAVLEDDVDGAHGHAGVAGRHAKVVRDEQG